MKRLRHMNEGDLVAIERDGVAELVLVGRIILGTSRVKKAERRAEMCVGVLAHSFDMTTLAYVPFSLRHLDGDIDVLDVVETAERRRRMRAIRHPSRDANDAGGDVDPIKRMQSNAQSAGLFERVAEGGIDDESIPF